jgi:hypothetical protein
MIDDKLKVIFSNPILFIENCCKIQDKNMNYVPFKLNKQQKQLIKMLMEKQFVIVCKQRQIGISSVTAAMAIYKCFTLSGCSCLLMSYRDSSVKDIYKKLRDIYRSIPAFIANGNKLVIENKNEMIFANGS